MLGQYQPVLGGNPFWWVRIVSSSFNYLGLNNHNQIWFLKLESGFKPNLVLNWRTWIWGGGSGLELRVNCHTRLRGPDFQNRNQNLNLIFQNWTGTRPKVPIFSKNWIQSDFLKKNWNQGKNQPTSVSTSNEHDSFEANTKGTSRLATGSVFTLNLLLFIPEYNTELQPAPFYFGEISPLGYRLIQKACL